MSAPLSVSLLADGDEPDWEAFVQGHPAATFFHRAGWRRVIAATYDHPTSFMMARRHGTVVGVLPLVHRRSMVFGSALISTGFCVQGGILAADAAARDVLAEAAVRLGRDLGVAYVELRSENAELAGWDTKAGVYATFRAQLGADEKARLQAIPRKKRADVRKAIAGPLTVETSAEPALVWRVYAESLRNLGTPVFPLRLVHAVAAEFGDAVELSVVRHGDDPVAALVAFFFKEQVLPYWGGALPAARPLHAYDLLYWSLMGRAVERGAGVFEFGRSKLGTVAFDYKRFWGFEPRPLHYQYRLIHADAVPDINPLNPKYRLMVEGWRRLPLSVTNRLGPLLSAHLA